MELSWHEDDKCFICCTGDYHRCPYKDDMRSMRTYYAITRALEAPRHNVSEVTAELLACFDRVPWWAEPVQEKNYTERSCDLLKSALDKFPYYDPSQIGIVEGPPHGTGVGQWMIVMFGPFANLLFCSFALWPSCRA